MLLDNSDIAAIVNRVPNTMSERMEINCPVYPSLHGYITPSLLQRGNYCAYYALFNAIAMDTSDELLPVGIDEWHETFKRFFATALTRIKQRRQSRDLTNLDAREMRFLLPAGSNIAVIELGSLFYAAQRPEITLEEIFELQNHAEENTMTAEVLRNFLARVTDKICILALVGHDEANSINHCRTLT